MKEVAFDLRLALEAGSFVACLATVLELSPEQLPEPPSAEDPVGAWHYSRWLGRFGLGMARIAEPESFSWPGPWIARVGQGTAERRFVVMFGVPSGVVWDPVGAMRAPAAGDLAAGDPAAGDQLVIEEGYLIAAGDIALALPPQPAAPRRTGRIEGIFVADAAQRPVRVLARARALAGRGLEGDRYVAGEGSFPSGPPGSALTLIEAEVCESFDPPLSGKDHRRNLVVRGLELNALVGREFEIGAVRCRGMRLCEPCTVLQRYAARPVLRALVHRGGLRADVLGDGEIALGDPVRVLA